MSLLILRGGCFDRNRALSCLIRIRYIEQSIIGMASNLTNYGPLITNTAVIEASFLPMILVGGIIGYYKYTDGVINIAQLTYIQFLLRAFFLSLIVGSFSSLGLEGFIADVFFLYKSYTPAVQAEFFRDLSLARYPVFSIMLCASLLRFPYTSLVTQHIGWYASNMLNGIGIALLDDFALYLLIDYSIGVLNGSDDFSSDEPIAPTFFCTLTALSYFIVFFFTFPTTPNLQPYSLEKNPIHPTFLTKTHRLFSAIKARCLPETNADAVRIKSSVSVGIEFMSERLVRVSRAWSSQFYSSTDVTPPVESPLHAPNHSLVADANFGSPVFCVGALSR